MPIRPSWPRARAVARGLALVAGFACAATAAQPPAALPSGTAVTLWVSDCMFRDAPGGRNANTVERGEKGSILFGCWFEEEGVVTIRWRLAVERNNVLRPVHGASVVASGAITGKSGDAACLAGDCGMLRATIQGDEPTASSRPAETGV